MEVNKALEDRNSNESKEIGAGDQGMMFGYATNETEEFMPYSICLDVAKPASIMIETFGTEKVESEKMLEIVNSYFDLRPNSIIEMLNLRKPIYMKTAAYGHFCRNEEGMS